MAASISQEPKLKPSNASIVSLWICLHFSPRADAALLYSVNVNTDELVQLDSDTGTVVNIGSLGFNALDVDLATVGNRLFALNSDFLNRVDLHELNPFTGDALSSNQVMLGASAVLNAEGLTQFTGQLKIGYSTAGNAASNGLGDLGLDGLITGGLSGSFDFDGLGENTASGQLYGLDREPPTRVDFFTVQPSPLSTNVFKTTGSELVVNDLVALGNDLFVIDQSNLLHRIDLTTNALSSVGLNPTGNFLGLAVVVPEPSETSLMLAAAMGAVMCLRRRR